MHFFKDNIIHQPNEDQINYSIEKYIEYWILYKKSTLNDLNIQNIQNDFNN